MTTKLEEWRLLAHSARQVREGLCEACDYIEALEARLALVNEKEPDLVGAWAEINRLQAKLKEQIAFRVDIGTERNRVVSENQGLEARLRVVQAVVDALDGKNVDYEEYPAVHMNVMRAQAAYEAFVAELK